MNFWRGYGMYTIGALIGLPITVLLLDLNRKEMFGVFALSMVCGFFFEMYLQSLKRRDK